MVDRVDVATLALFLDEVVLRLGCECRLLPLRLSCPFPLDFLKLQGLVLAHQACEHFWSISLRGGLMGLCHRAPGEDAR